MQAVDVEAICCLGRARRIGIGACGILQILDDAAVLVDGEDVTVRFAHGQERAGQAEQYLSRERPLREAVRREVARSAPTLLAILARGDACDPAKGTRKTGL